MAKQTRLTPEQLDKFYGEYVRMKQKKFAGDIMDKKVWKSQVELIMIEELNTGMNWSNTEIRRANRLLMRSGEWTDKQVNAFLRNVDEELKAAIIIEFNLRPQDFNNFVMANHGAIFQFLQNWSNDWNEYFNS